MNLPSRAGLGVLWFMILGWLIIGGIAGIAVLAQPTFQPTPGPVGACTPGHSVSTASTNATNIKTTAGVLCSIIITNTSASAAFLKLSDAAAAPTCGTTAVVQTMAVGATTGQASYTPLSGVNFVNGIGFCVTGAIGDADSTNTATGIAISWTYK